MSEDNKQLVLGMIDEAMNKGNVTVLDRLIADDFTDHVDGPPMGPPGVSDKQAFRHITEAHHETFADLHIEFLEAATDGDKVALRQIMSGRHVKDWMDMKARGREFAFQVFHMYRVHDGQVTDHWGTRQEMQFFLQLGVVPGMLLRLGAPGKLPEPLPAAGHRTVGPMKANEQTARRVLEEVLGGGDLELVDKLFLPDAGYETPGDEAQGLTAYKQAITATREAFEGLTVEVQDVVGEDDAVFVRAMLRGTHVGEWATIAPSGRDVAFRVIHLVSFTDGQISGYVESSDESAMWRQMGAVPAPLRRLMEETPDTVKSPAARR